MMDWTQSFGMYLMSASRCCSACLGLNADIQLFCDPTQDSPAFGFQARAEQDEHIRQLEKAAQEIQEQLAAANVTAKQYANSLQQVKAQMVTESVPPSLSVWGQRRKQKEWGGM